MDAPHTRQSAAESRRYIDGLLDRWVEGVKSDACRPLYTLNEVQEFRHSVHGYPTVYKLIDTKLGPIIPDDTYFRTQFINECPTLADFDFTAVGLVLAGGAACRWARIKAKWPLSDLDFFPVGHDTDVTAALEALAEHLRGKCKTLVCKRTGMFVEFQAGKLRVQVILCTFADIGEVLYSFDLGSSAVAWDGRQVWFSEVGRYAHATGRNVVCLPFRGPGYEHRLDKYFERGFSIVMPNLKSRDITGNEDCSLGRMNLIVRSCANGERCDCHIYARWVQVTYTETPSQYESLGDSPSESARLCLDTILDPAKKRLISDSISRLVSIDLCVPGCFSAPAPVDCNPELLIEALQKYASFPGDTTPWIRFLGPERAISLFIEQSARPDEAKELALAAVETKLADYVFEVPLFVRTTKGCASVWDIFWRTPETPKEWYGEWYQAL